MAVNGRNHISKIAIVGATGSLGTSLLSALLAEPRFSITIITRPGSITPESHSALISNPRIAIKTGSYTDPAFLASALTGQDALVVALSFMVCHELQPDIIRVACQVKVPHILPCEFGSDTGNPALIDAIPIQQAKVDARKLVDDLGIDNHGTRTSSWIGIVNNPWYDWSLPSGFFGIDPKTRKALIFDNGDVKAYLSTVELAGKAAAKVLSLPLNANSKGQRTLPSYANKFVFVRGLELSQRDILKSVQRVTNTTDADWEVSYIPVKEHIQDGANELENGNFLGIMKVLYGNTFVPGVGTDYRDAKLDNKALGLDDLEDLDAITAKVLSGINGPHA
jgi:hypothetical protein